MDHGDVNHGFAVARQDFIVFAQDTVMAQPSKGALDDPATRQEDKAFAAFRSFDDREDPVADGLHPGDQPTDIVAAIGPDQAQPPMTTPHSFQYSFGSVLLLDAGRVHDHHQNQPQDINQQVTFAARHFLGAVVAALPPFSVVFTD